MSCPYLWGTYLYSCSASREVYIPTAAELQEYCDPYRYDRFSLCPEYRKSDRDASALRKVAVLHEAHRPITRRK